MANTINWGKIYEKTAWGIGVVTNTISWGKIYANLAGLIPSFSLNFANITNDFTFTRSSFATRVNEFGLIETVTDLGSELVTNGDFEALGSELVTNGDFDTDSDWTFSLGASYDNGTALFATDGSSSIISQTIFSDATATNKSYLLTYEIKSYTSGSLKLSGGSSAFGTVSLAGTVGVHSIILTRTQAQNSLIFFPTNYIGSIDNVSIKQVDPNDNWILFSDVSVTDGKLVSNVSAFTSIAAQTNIIPETKLVQLKFDTVVNSGTLRLLLGSGGDVTEVTATGSYTFNVNSGTGGNLSLFGRSGGFDGSIDNVSVKEVLEDDVPRIDYTGSTFDVPVLGDELVVNGSFATDSNWIKETGWTINNGVATQDGTGVGVLAQLVQDVGVAFNVSKQYKVKFDVTATDGDRLYIRLGGSGITIDIPTTTIQTYEYIVNASGTNSYVYIEPIGFAGSVDNVSVKEVTAYTTTDKGSFLLEPQSTNLYLNSETLSTQDVTTLASTYTVSFRGTGTITFSGSHVGSLVGTGSMDLVSVTFTATAGTLTSTVSGDVKYAQIEELGYSTSWIPTEGSTATRSAELCVDATPTINSEEGVLYFEGSNLVSGNSSNRMVTLNSGDISAYIQLLWFGTNDNFRVAFNGTPEGFSTKTIANIGQDNNNKIAVRYSSDGAYIFINGSQAGELVGDFSFPTGTLTELDFDIGSGSSYFYGRTKDLKIYDKALTDEELTELTTI